MRSMYKVIAFTCTLLALGCRIERDVAQSPFSIDASLGGLGHAGRPAPRIFRRFWRSSGMPISMSSRKSSSALPITPTGARSGRRTVRRTPISPRAAATAW